MPDGLITFKLSPESDADGRSIRTTLSTHLAAENAHRTRVLLVHVMAAFSVALWLLAVWPSLLSPSSRRLVLVGWLMSAAGALAALVREWCWRWRLSAIVAEMSARSSRARDDV